PTNSGTFTVVVSSFYYDNQADAVGAYRLTLARVPGAFVVSPGDEGGLLTSAMNPEGVITPGDMDLWRFSACRGRMVTLRCEELTGGTAFSPRMRLFGANGALLATVVNASNAVINFQPMTTAAYTVLVDGGNLNDAGTYRLSGSGLPVGLNVCLPVIAGTNL